MNGHKKLYSPQQWVFAVLCTVGVWAVQAEPLSTTVSADAFAVREHAEVQGPLLLLQSNSRVACAFEFPGDDAYRFVLISRADNPQKLQVVLDDTPCTVLDIPTGSMASISFAGEIRKGPHMVRFMPVSNEMQGVTALSSLTVLPSNGGGRATPLNAAAYRAARRGAERVVRRHELARVRRSRMGQLDIRVLDADARPEPDADVCVKQYRQACPLGIVVDDADCVFSNRMLVPLASAGGLTGVINALYFRCTGIPDLPGTRHAVYGFDRLTRLARWARDRAYTLRTALAAIPAVASQTNAATIAAKRRARVMAARFQDRISEYDVSFNGRDMPPERSTFYLQLLHEMRVADPQIRLNAVCGNLRAQKAFRQCLESVQALNTAGARISGITVTLPISEQPALPELRDRLNSLHGLGWPVTLMIELHAVNDRVLDVMPELLRSVYATPAVWGIYFDFTDVRETPTGISRLAEAITPVVRREWYTTLKGKTDRRGRMFCQVFYGEHYVDVSTDDGRRVRSRIRLPVRSEDLHLLYRLPEGIQPTSAAAMPSRPRKTTGAD